MRSGAFDTSEVLSTPSCDQIVLFEFWPLQPSVDEKRRLGYQMAMICNESLLFVHVPKTGGMSITHSLLKHLPRPVYYSLPAEEVKDVPSGVEIVTGTRHQFLTESLVMARQLGLEPKILLACIRSPYDMEVSRFHFLLRRKERRPEKMFAITDNFEEFVLESRFHGQTASEIEQYFLVDGEMPPSLRILRSESLDEDYGAVMADMGIEVEKLPRQNATNHDHFNSFMTPKIEEAIYNRYRWVFDRGMYSRLTFDS